MRISFNIESKVFEMIYIQEFPGNSDDENCWKTFFHQMIKIIILLKTYHVLVESRKKKLSVFLLCLTFQGLSYSKTSIRIIYTHIFVF